MLAKKKVLSLHYKNHPLEIAYFIHLWDATTILFLHWLGSSKDVFLGATQDKKINRHTLIGFDFPWHGDSSYIAKLDIDDLVQITRLVIEALELKEFILVGHSMWGLVGLLYLQNNVHSIKAFINVEWNLAKDDCEFSWYIASLDYGVFKEEFWDNPAMFDLSPSVVSYSKSWKLLNLFYSLSLPKLYIYGENSKISKISINGENGEISYISELENNKIQTTKISQSWHHPFDTNPTEFYEAIENYIVDNGF